MIDEIYSAQRIEYSNGKFYGGYDDQVTKTLLCFMIASVAGRYKDVIAMVPLTKISGDIIASHYDVCLKSLKSVGFDICCTSIDGYSATRTFYVENLCFGTIICNSHAYYILMIKNLLRI